MDLNEPWLNSLVIDRREEFERLEFKACLPTRDDEGKKEFLKDVTAMANAEGGHIVYGVAEDKGAASEIVPISSEVPDDVIRRLGQSLDACVEPRLDGVDFQEIKLAGGGYVLVVHVPRSFTGPHRVTFKGRSSFPVRTQRYVSEFSYTQLRDAFNLRARAEDRIRAFRAERLAHVKSGHGRNQVRPGAHYLVHILPLVSFASGSSVHLGAFMPQAKGLLFGRLGNVSNNWNLDGILARAHLDQEHDYKYVQLFRTGAIETVGFAGTLVDAGGRFIPAKFLAGEFRKALTAHAAVLAALNIKGPLAVSISLLSVGDYKLAPTQFETWATDRDDLVLPELWVGSAEALAEKVDDVARPMLDTLWQCFDVDRCTLYDEHGTWKE